MKHANKITPKPSILGYMIFFQVDQDLTRTIFQLITSFQTDMPISKEFGRRLKTQSKNVYNNPDLIKM